MDTKFFIKTYFKMLNKAAQKIEIDSIGEVIKILEKKFNLKKTIFIAGNGGSAATASHMVCDLNKTVLGKTPKQERKRFRVICLNDNIPLLTAIGNDLSYELVFSEPLRNYGRKGDLLLVITGSGNSKNVIEAVRVAKILRMDTVAFLGFDGGKVRNLVDKFILVPFYDYGVVEDLHMVLVHLITFYFKERLSK